MANEQEDNNDKNELNIQNLNVAENGADDINVLKKKNEDMKALLTKAIKLLKEKTAMCLTLEKQNTALNIQINSLKDVVAITKNLLGIRNMEVENMHKDMSSLQEKINEERARQNLVLKTVDTASRINSDIKSEYESQMNIFQQLKEKYNEKVDLLSRENKKLQDEVAELSTALLNKLNGELSNSVTE